LLYFAIIFPQQSVESAQYLITIFPRWKWFFVYCHIPLYIQL